MKTTTLKIIAGLTIELVRQLSVATISGVGSETQLASSPAGRIVLHLLCARRDHHFRWHWHGIVREFAKS